MNIDSSVLRYGEKIGAQLCDRYRRYGYAQYQMSKFEEYDLYARNKDFLISDTVLTFTDLSGKLMALKPDVTLSIVRNTRDDISGVQKVCYAENVYRVARGSRAFHEIRQAGLECIGGIDEYQIAEVLTLAAESLRQISARCVLDISHLDILSEALDRLGVDRETRQKLLKCVGEKNRHELTELCREAGAPEAAAETVCRLLELGGTPEEVLPQLKQLDLHRPAVSQLERICRCLAAAGLSDMLRIDFSVVNDMTYYNGIVLKGFVDGVPEGVLSGGQYDRLMRKMGRSAGAIGFAVYLDALERLDGGAPEYDVDVLLLYQSSDEIVAIAQAVKRLTEQGLCVSAQTSVPEKLKYKRLAKLQGSEVVTLEANA